MPFQIINEDILKIKADAVVNPSNIYLKGLGSTDFLIHQKAGVLLDEECRKLGGIGIGEAVITKSYEMDNCNYIIHTAGPEYIDGNHNERQLLRNCYDSCLNIALNRNLESVAFPLIGAGTCQFPKGQAIEIASSTIIDFLNDHDMDIYLLVYDKGVFDTSKDTFIGVEEMLTCSSRRSRSQLHGVKMSVIGSSKPARKIRKSHKEDIETVNELPSEFTDVSMPNNSFNEEYYSESGKIEAPFVSFIKEPVNDKTKLQKESVSFADTFVPDESFGEYMISVIDSKNLKDSDVYRKANLSKSVFNDIKLNRHKPKKETLCALCIGMKLSLQESLDFLDRGGYTLSRHMTFDRIIRYFLQKEYYDIFEINEVLYNHDCLLLGSKSH